MLKQHDIISFSIYIKEWPAIFNKAAMMNAAFLEIAKENQTWDCIVFHDVDVYMEDDRNIIHCRDHSHICLVASLDRWHYKYVYICVALN